MLVVMKPDVDQHDLDRVCEAIRDMGLEPHPIPGQTRTAIGMTGNIGPVDPSRLAALPGVVQLIHVRPEGIGAASDPRKGGRPAGY